MSVVLTLQLKDIFSAKQKVCAMTSLLLTVIWAFYNFTSYHLVVDQTSKNKTDIARYQLKTEFMIKSSKLENQHIGFLPWSNKWNIPFKRPGEKKQTSTYIKHGLQQTQLSPALPVKIKW